MRSDLGDRAIEVGVDETTTVTSLVVVWPALSEITT
jgi:hypothetical protein